MPKDIISYPFSEQQLHLLNSKGFFNVQDIKELSPTELGEELNIGTEKALDLLNIASEDGDAPSNSCLNKSAYELLQEEEDEVPIVTFCAALDNMIGGGVATGEETLVVCPLNSKFMNQLRYASCKIFSTHVG